MDGSSLFYFIFIIKPREKSMQQIHFIAIGGSAMHNLAIALKNKGYKVTGSDDEFFEPSKSRLQKHGLLPEYQGWNPDHAIHAKLDAVILGMHAKADNPELLKAQSLAIPIFSYPEYLFEQTKTKKRIVIGGSHGKTSVTSMMLHALKHTGQSFDFMVGAQIEGFDTMVQLSDDSDLAVFEGDEYLSSTLDQRPKFHLYTPHIAIITGIAWDHINVFPDFEIYKAQFTEFIRRIEPKGTLIYYGADKHIEASIKASQRTDLKLIPYQGLKTVSESKSTVIYEQDTYPLNIFGRHNMENMNAALIACAQVGIKASEYLKIMKSFQGASKRLQLIAASYHKKVFLDFAHAPSKVKATLEAVREKFPKHNLIAVLELHTYSSLNIEYMKEYANVLDAADHALVYYNRHTLEIKCLPPFNDQDVRDRFKTENLIVVQESEDITKYVSSMLTDYSVILIMTSGSLGKMDIKREFSQIIFSD
jgi:UDP-N-acetylmuramate: L-alanyl-gamma-D-glutamyl-meso-diaminopimelate ligase